MSENANNGSQKSELIEKLKTIERLYAETCVLEYEIENYTPEDNYEREYEPPIFPFPYEVREETLSDEIQDWVFDFPHDSDNAVEMMGEKYDAIFYWFEEPKLNIRGFNGANTTELEKKKSRSKIFSYIALALAGFYAISVLVALISDTPFVNPSNLMCVALFGGLFLYFFMISPKKIAKKIRIKEEEARIEYEEYKAREEANYKENLEKYEEYLNARKSFLDRYIGWKEDYIKWAEEDFEITEKLEADRVAYVENLKKEKYEPAMDALNSYNDGFVADNYLAVLGDIIDLLTSGRADTYKEAINLYEEICFRERQEEQRQYEEEQRQLEEYRRYEEEKEFRERQEEQRRYEEEQRQREDRRRYEEEKQFRELQEAQRQLEVKQDQARQEKQRKHEEELARDNAKTRCDFCANKWSCGLKHTRAACTCTAFIPR